MNKIRYLQKYFDGPKQGSDSWREMRKFRFGGSELKDVHNVLALIDNRYKDPSKFDESLYCWWGKWFEEVSKQYLMKKDKMQIYEFSAIPCAKIPVAYSPDGLFVRDNDCWLLEIKCPFLKEKPKETDYMKQIQAGLYILPTKKCLLCINIFRRCSFQQLTIPRSYDALFHKPWFKGTFYKPYFKTEEIFVGMLIWEEENKKEIYHFRIPEKIVIGRPEDITKVVNEMKNGHYIYFKCFQANEKIIEKNNSMERTEDFLWAQYDKFVNSQTPNPTDSTTN